MSQSKTTSFVECALNNISGIVIGWVTSIVVFPLFGLSISTSQNLRLTIIFTVVSMVRSYFWRRFFTLIQVGSQNQTLTKVLPC